MVRAKALMHGKTSPIHHEGKGVFAGLPDALHRHALPQPRGATATTLPAALEVTAWTEDGEIMGLQHRPGRSTACSSTPNPSPPSTATTCWPTSWTSPASSAPWTPDARLMSDAFKPLLSLPGRRRRRCRRTTPRRSSPPACAASRRRPRSARPLTAMRMRGETVGEIIACARAMRRAAVRSTTPIETIDVCGTGGDGAHTLNISTAVGFVAAGGGLKVAKHGTRALSSRSGSPTC